MEVVRKFLSVWEIRWISYTWLNSQLHHLWSWTWSLMLTHLPCMAWLGLFLCLPPFLSSCLHSSCISLVSLECFHPHICYFVVISQTLKHVWDMFNFNTTSNPCGCLVLFVSKTMLAVWYFIMNLIPLKVHGYFTLFELKSMVIFICIHCLIISFKHCKFTRTLCGVFPLSKSELLYSILLVKHSLGDLFYLLLLLFYVFKAGDLFVIASLIID